MRPAPSIQLPPPFYRCSATSLVVYYFRFLGVFCFSSLAWGQPCVLHIDVARTVVRVSPLHAGLMTEEINHAYDGGLYAELISNRVFQDGVSVANPLPPHWT